MSFVTHLVCSWTGKPHAADRLQGLSEAGKPLLVRYDLRAVSAAVDREALRARSEPIKNYQKLFKPQKSTKGTKALFEYVS